MSNTHDTRISITRYIRGYTITCKLGADGCELRLLVSSVSTYEATISDNITLALVKLHNDDFTFQKVADGFIVGISDMSIKFVHVKKNCLIERVGGINMFPAPILYLGGGRFVIDHIILGAPKMNDSIFLSYGDHLEHTRMIHGKSNDYKFEPIEVYSKLCITGKCGQKYTLCRSDLIKIKKVI